MAVNVRLGFRNASDKKVITMTETVLHGMTDNRAFRKPAVDLVTLRAGLDDFKQAIAAQPNRGKAGTAVKDQKRERLQLLLQKQAHYVQANCNDDLATLLSSGFTAKDANRRSIPLPKAAIMKLRIKRSGQILVQSVAHQKAKMYELRIAVRQDNGTLEEWRPAGSFSNSQSMPVNGLTFGTTYAFQVRMYSGAGPSEWSDPVELMCR